MKTVTMIKSFPVLLAILLSVAACGDGASDVTNDSNKPTVDLVKTTAPDSILAFTANATDNLGIKNVHVEMTGGITAVFDTTFTSAVTDATLSYSLTVPSSVPAGTAVTLIATVTDGSGNVSAPDTLRLATGNLAAPDVSISSPVNGTIAVVGRSLVLSLRGSSPRKVRFIGFQTSGPVTTADSTSFNSPLSDSVSTLDTLDIPSSATSGSLVLTPFLRDSLGQRVTGSSVTLTLQTAAATNSVPVVSFGITPRIETTDTLHVEATDQTGITAMGYELRQTPTGAVDIADSIISSGQFTSQIRTFNLRLPYTVFPDTVFVKAFARNGTPTGNRTYAKLASGVDRVDTVIVVAGVTRPLPNGGLVADALYHPGKDRLYLTNIERNQLEVFNLADSSFRTAINVGSRPWGIAAWPRDRNGTMADTLLVANSGGTNISYVNLNAGSTGSEATRYALPNIIVYTVTTERNPTTNVLFSKRTRRDFSDRPQYIGATCQGAGPGCGDVVLVYSTTPTPGQSAPFQNKGTVRWENLTDSTSHFFYEHAEGQGEQSSDTLEIVRYDGYDRTDSTTLVPFQQMVVNGADTTFLSVVVDVPLLAFRDTTYVRNSGDFRRAIIGEGGPILGSRAISYDITRGFRTVYPLNGTNVPIPTPYEDLGISPSFNVADFIANTFQRVSGVAINFSGDLSAIRGDSTYIIGSGGGSLRLEGLLQTTASNSGIDFHPANTGLNSSPLNTRLIFAASTQPVIEIYDSRCYKLVATVPVRDPIIGPIKSAIRPLTGELMLIGATARGVVIVTLPNTFSTTCT